MAEKLIELISTRGDQHLILEILRYDWLRCGHRYLPDCLGFDESAEAPADTKGFLYNSLPEEIEGVYRKGNRNYFFKKSSFMRMSREALSEIDIPDNGGNCIVSILPERENSLHKLNKVLLF